jgi:hypothetical protein
VGLILSPIQVLVLRVLDGAEDGQTAGALAAATAAARTMPVTPALMTLQARGLVRRHPRCASPGERTQQVWSLTPLGQHTRQTMQSVDGLGAIVEVGHRRIVPAGQGDGEC